MSTDRRKPLEDINNAIVQCRDCPRLTPYIQRIAEEKVKRFRDQAYWGKPLPGFGDPNGRMLIVGLAPAAHGANRTGRMFTGDRSGDWLYGALYDTGFSNQRASVTKDDGLELYDAYITAVIRCAPPKNKPTRAEIGNCSQYFHHELELFRDTPVILCLGRLAFDETRKYFGMTGLDFGHGKEHRLTNGQTLLCSYHPSQQNTQTGRLQWPDWVRIFERAKTLIKAGSDTA